MLFTLNNLYFGQGKWFLQEFNDFYSECFVLQSILGDYEWKTYGEVFDEVKYLGRGLAAAGMTPSKHVLIFAETRADWMIAAQACFRQNFQGIAIIYTVLTQ